MAEIWFSDRNFEANFGAFFSSLPGYVLDLYACGYYCFAKQIIILQWLYRWLQPFGGQKSEYKRASNTRNEGMFEIYIFRALYAACTEYCERLPNTFNAGARWWSELLDNGMKWISQSLYSDSIKYSTTHAHGLHSFARRCQKEKHPNWNLILFLSPWNIDGTACSNSHPCIP